GAENADGGFPGSPGERSSELYSAWAAIALAGAGENPGTAVAGKRSPLHSIRAEAGTLEGIGDAERTMLALHACGVDPGAIGDRDLEAQVLAGAHADGSVGGQVNLTAFAILALRGAGRAASDPVLHAATAWLAAQQNPGGGFGYGARGAASDVDDTGAALEALLAGGTPQGSGAVSAAVGYLRAAQSRDGGFPQQPGQVSDAQSSAWAVQGLIAAGIDPSALRAAPGAPGATAFLERMQMRNGAFRYSPGSEQTPVWVTAEVLPALAGRPLPIAAPVPQPAAGTASEGTGTAGGPGGAGAVNATRAAGEARTSTRGPAPTVRPTRGSAQAAGSAVGAWFPGVLATLTSALDSFAHRSVAEL
ncbi:MAG: prenyltransferase/squalene oxidase repeat-containing protein, partial [Solirubrobacteraceae bacterium]